MKKMVIKGLIIFEVSLLLFVSSFVWLYYSTDANSNLGGWNYVHGKIIIHDYRCINKYSIMPAIYSFIVVFLYRILSSIEVLVVVNRKRHRIVFEFLNIVMLFIILIWEVSGIIPGYIEQEHIVQMRNVISAEKAIVHGAGSIEGLDGKLYSYTNSLEALSNSYYRGNKICEMDFIWTNDGELVCGHDGGDEWATGIDTEGKADLSLDEYLSKQVFNQFTTIGVDQLAEFLRKNKTLYIVTDIKWNNIGGAEYIAKHCPDLLDRFIIQIYHYNEYEAIKEIGFQNVILTLYQTSMEERTIERIVNEVKNCNLLAITFREDYIYKAEDWMNGEDFYNIILDTDIPICVHTVDDMEKIKCDLEKGVTAVYTNNVDNEWLR